MQNQTRRDILALGAAAAGGLALTATAGKAKADDSDLLALYDQWLKAETESRRVNACYDNALGATFKIPDPTEKAAAQDRLRHSELAAQNDEASDLATDIARRIFQMDPTTSAGIAAYLRACFWIMPGDDAEPGDESAALTVIEACERMAGRAS